MFQTREQAVQAALREQQARQCATGRHQRGCPHRQQQGPQQPQKGA